MKELENYIADIHCALDARAALSALALALALPDVCKSLEFSDPTRSTNAKTYVDWCHAHVETKAVITPEHLYAIRCAYLHNGSGEITTRQRTRGSLVRVNFTWDREGHAYIVGFQSQGEPVEHEITTSFDILCHLLIKATRTWMKKFASDPVVLGNLDTLVDGPST